MAEVQSSATGPVADVALPTIADVVAGMSAAPVEGAPADAPEAVEEILDAAPVEEAPVPVAAPKESPDRAASRFAALSKKEKAIREQQTRIDAADRQRKSELDQREAAFNQKMKQFEDREAAIKGARRPMDLLKAAGFEYKDAVEDVIGGYTPKEADPLDQRLSPMQEQMAKIAKENDALLKRIEAQEHAASVKEQEQQYRQFVDAVKHTISTGLEKYELTSSLGDDAIDIVRETMLEYSRRNGSLPDYTSACDMVEEFLEKRYVEPFANTKKWQSRISVPAPEPKVAPKAAAPKAKTPPKTLSSNLGSTGAGSDDVDKMNKHDALAHIARMFG